MACEARTFYCFNIETHVGKQNQGEFHKSNSPADFLKPLVTSLAGSQRTVITDNYFTSAQLASDLKNGMQLNLVGTVRANKTIIL